MITLYVLLGVVAILSIFVIMTYNGIVSLANQVKNSWANVLVQEQQKQKIVPRLLEAVKGYSDFESTLGKYNKQMDNVKNNKEYDALLIEIDHLKKENDELMDKIINIDETIESLNELKNEHNEKVIILDNINEIIDYV